MKRILIISELFYPKNAIGALRPTKIRKYLTEKGYTVDVITKSFSANDDSENGRIWRIDAVKETNVSKSAPTFLHTNNSFIKGLKRFKRIIISLKSGKRYYRDVMRFIDTHPVPISEYDAVFTTFGPVSSVLIGLELKKRYPKIKWICDFRDPMVVEEVSVFLKPYMRALQNRACRKADKIIAVSNGFLKRICQNRYADKRYMIPNGYDPSDMPDMLSARADGILHFVYAGALYEGKRKITPLFRALRELADEGKINIEKICFDYAGNDFMFLNEQAKSYNMSEILKNHGKLSRADCLALQKAADFLVLCTWNNRGEEGVFPGKFLEYMLFNKPIIALVDGNLANSEVACVMREGKFGIACEAAGGERDHAALKAYIEKQYSLFEQNKSLDFAPSQKVLNRYNYENIIRRIEELIYE
ncbi:MAG: glycosyltransferase [Acutalibacteraceae bacterium]